MGVSAVLMQLGDKLFEFSSFDNWCNSATAKYHMAGASSKDSLAVDAIGRVCVKGKEFMRARDENCFPITVYRTLVTV